ncbi:MAG: SAM-dependent methyltransferase [Theionarchaea archaeon]|nr:SAM-dependent methyltransferase [Theionarchaea archaeon]MBU7036866.1 SAM-dependent methyltransferase [Theionarchaea archaeon]
MEIMTRIKPNSARMWDYIMGGAHNFAIDRTAVKLARTLYPHYEESMRAQRRFLQRAVTFMVKEKNLRNILDFGSGLPTRGNVHELVRKINPKTKVIYSDRDPIAVAFGQEILGDIPNVRYVYCDVEEPHTLLDSPVIPEMFGDSRRMGIGFVGVFLYVPDEPLERFFDLMYEWVDKGSYIAVSSAGLKVSEVEGVNEASKKMDMRFYARSEEKTIDIIKPWKLTQEGLAKGFYWGLPDDSPEINEDISKLSYTFVAYK